ncbi:MAG: GNAT family N-acetyltransferase [Anaerolineales bacterium]|nr:GNAT family N-acetyltransferase [Anaerolineales bacterium]
MKLVKYTDPILFQESVKEHLLIHEAENNLPLGILSSVIAGEYREQTSYLAQVVDQGAVKLVVMRTPPYPVLLSFEEVPPNQDIINLVVKDFWNEFGDELSGMTGSKELVSLFTTAWQATSGKTAILKMAMRIYKLEQVSPVSGVKGSIRPAQNNDEDLLRDWFKGFYQDTMVDIPDPERIQTGIERYLSADPLLRGMMIWEDENKPVSMAGYAGPTTNGIRVGAVYTPPVQRKKGYASACVAGLSQHLMDLGFKFCFLFTDLMNPTSNHIYQQIGYQSVSDVDTFEFK